MQSFLVAFLAGLHVRGMTCLLSDGSCHDDGGCEDVGLVQTKAHQGKVRHNKTKTHGTCNIGDHVFCPNSTSYCSGEQCCSGSGGTYPCPSAPPGWGKGHCSSEVKVENCLGDDYLCHEIEQITSLSAPVNPRASPACWQLRLSEQKRRLEPEKTRNTAGEEFPNVKCGKKLGAEYNFDDAYEFDVIDFTAKTMAQRILNVGAYDTAGSCPEGNMGNPNCCNFSAGTQMNYAEYPHLCWRWPNDIPWNHQLVPGATQQNPKDNTRTWDGFAQYGGCKDGKRIIPGTDQLTWCEAANDYYKVGCHTENNKLNVTDCDEHPQSTMYIYNMPNGVNGGRPNDPAVNFHPDQMYDVYGAAENITFLNPTMPKPAPFGKGGKNGDKDLSDWEWRFHQMHGKGYSCIDARVKMLDECEEAKLKEKGIETIPEQWRIGVFKKKENGEGRQWPAMVRISGNRNHTLYDWHDVRVQGFAFKLYDAEDVTGPNGEFRIQIPTVPRTDYAGGDPPITPTHSNPAPKYAPSGIPDANAEIKGDLTQLQNLTTLDFTFIAVRGQYQHGCNETSTKCIYNQFPAGGNAQCYSPQFLYGTKDNADGCKYTEADRITHATWNPLNYTFGTAAPMMLGDGGAMLITVQPCGEAESSDGKTDYWKKLKNDFQDPANPNFKYHNLKATLKESDMELCIWVQLQENPCEQEVENLGRWDTPIRLAGRIYIERGTAARYNDVCDNTAFHPYRQLVSHMPIGSLNRMRNTVYAYAATFRLYKNHGASESLAEKFASVLPLRQKNAAMAPKTPAKKNLAKCPLGFVR